MPLPAADWLWVTYWTAEGELLLRLDPVTLVVTGELMISRGRYRHGAQVTYAGGWLWTDGGNRLLRVSADSVQPTAVIPLPGASWSGVAASPDGRILVVSEHRGKDGFTQRRDPRTGVLLGVAAPSRSWRAAADLATLGHMFGSIPAARAGTGPGVTAFWRRALAFLRVLAGRRQDPPPSASPRRPRPVIVPDSLDDLKGPKSGVVELPVTLFWSLPDRRFDLGNRCQAIGMYLAVLDAAHDPGDLAAYLNGELLAGLWPDLHLTRAKRAPWEARFEALRPGAAAA